MTKQTTIVVIGSLRVNMDDNFCNFLFASLCTMPLLKEVYFNMEKIAPNGGGKCYPLRVDPFWKGGKNSTNIDVSPESVC